jgi:myosin-1
VAGKASVAAGVARAPPAIPGRGAPPPPPPPPAASAKEMYKVLYNFAGQEGEMNLVKGEEVEVKEKDDNGWWLVVKSGTEGWAPSN